MVKHYRSMVVCISELLLDKHKLRTSVVKFNGLAGLDELMDKINFQEESINKTKENLTALARSKDELLGIEKENYETSIVRLQNKLQVQNDNLAWSIISKEYPIIDLSFLELKKRQTVSAHTKHGDIKINTALPIFGVYHHKSPDYQIEVSGRVYFEIDGYSAGRDKLTVKSLGRFPEGIDEHIEKITTYGKWGGNEHHFKTILNAPFSGYIPQNIKDVIKKEKEKFNDQIYIVGEVQRWNDTKLKNQQSQNYLLIGVQKRKAFLLEEFNLNNQGMYAYENYLSKVSKKQITASMY